MKPAAKGLGVQRIFIRGKGRKYVIADSAFKRMQVDACAFGLDAEESSGLCTSDRRGAQMQPVGWRTPCVEVGA